MIAFAIALTYTLASAAGLVEKLKPITLWYFLRDIIVAVLGFFGSILAYFRGGSGGDEKGTESKDKEGGSGSDETNPKTPSRKKTLNHKYHHPQNARQQNPKQALRVCP